MIKGLSKRKAQRVQTKGRATRRNPAKKAYPSFVGLKPASEVSSLSKRANKSRGTKHEVMLQRALRRLGLRFRHNVATLPGKPDIVFPFEKVVVFCDGDFWHGRDWITLSGRLSRDHNSAYWQAKIQRNRERDRTVNRALKGGGWRVIRVWEGDVKQAIEPIAQRIFHSIRGTNGYQY